MQTCFLCDLLLTEKNKSKEHIILNAIGGRLKSSNLLCKSCNSLLGHRADSELANQFLFIASFLQIKREKGAYPVVKGATSAKGVEYHIGEGGKPILSKPTVSIKEVGNKLAIDIVARDESELNHILKNVKRNYPSLDIEKVKSEMRKKEEYLNEPLIHNVEIGGDLAFLSIAKSAINFYIENRQEKNNVSHLFNYLKGEENARIVKLFYPHKRPYKRKSNEIIHLLHLVGRKQEKLLYCYIELFSAFGFLVLLSRDYKGKNFTNTYCYELISGNELKKDVKMKLSRDDFDLIFSNDCTDYESVNRELNRVFKIGYDMQVRNKIGDICSDAVDRNFKNKYGHEPYITEQMITEFVEEVSTSYVRFMLRTNEPM